MAHLHIVLFLKSVFILAILAVGRALLLLLQPPVLFRCLFLVFLFYEILIDFSDLTYFLFGSLLFIFISYGLLFAFFGQPFFFLQLFYLE